ncbi:MAG TPA: glycosyltransferase family 4 protein [Patescibacteria group bacterium]|nr:glycosyltransferase family 4 protein [Patescibacteria group bacterium]
MKIGIYDPYLDTMSGGEKYMLSIALCLQENHEVTIFWDKTPVESICQLAKERFDFDLSRLQFAPSIFSKDVSLLHRLKESEKYDEIILLSDGSIPVLACRLIVHFQSPMLWLQGKSIKSRLKLHRVKHIICNSRFTKSFIDNIFATDSVVVYPPVSLQGSFDPAKKENIILNVGRFGIYQAGSSLKKQDVLADTFRILVAGGLKKWKLVLVMAVMDKDREAVEKFKEKYKDLPIEFVINPPSHDLWQWYEKARIYWHAAGFGEDIATHPDRAEHFGMATVEAMGVGAVPIVVNAGGQKEIVTDGQNGRLWNTLEELQSFTLEAIARPHELEEMVQAGLKTSKEFSFERFCHEITSLVA